MSFSLKFRFQVNPECQITMCICDHHSLCSRDPTSPEDLIKIFALSQSFILFSKDPLKRYLYHSCSPMSAKKKVQKVLLSCNSLHWAEQRLPSWRTANALLLTKACFLSQLFRIQQHDFRNSCRRGGYVKISELWDSVPDTFHKSLCYLLTIFFFQV